MNIDDLNTIHNCVVTKTPPSFYYDSGLETEEDIKKPVNLTIDHECFISYLEILYDGIVVYRGDTSERYYCNAYTEFKEYNYRTDFTFTFYRNITNNTYYTESDPENGPQRYPEDTNGTKNYYFLPEMLKMLFFNPPTYEDMYY